MPTGRISNLEGLTAVLTEALSDPRVTPTVDVVDVAAPTAEVVVHLRRLADVDLTLRRDARDPFLAARDQLTPSLLRDLSQVEDDLFDWLEGARDRPARLMHDPAAVLRNLPAGSADTATGAEARQRLAATLGGRGAPVPRMAGLAVSNLTIDTTPSDPAPTPASHDPQVKQSTAADAVLEIGLAQLSRILDGEVVAGVRQRASTVSFATPLTGGTQHGILKLLLEHPADPRVTLDTSSPTDTITVTIGFPEAVLELGTGPLATAVPIPLGDVEISAKLALRDLNPSATGSTLALQLVNGSIKVSGPTNLAAIPVPDVLAVPADKESIRQTLWNAAAGEVATALAPFYDLAIPLRFGPGRCGISPRGVTSVLRDGGPDTEPSLALFMSLLESPATTTPTDTGPSLVPDGADGHLLLSNRLMLELACCLLQQSGAITNLPDRPTPIPGDDELCCRWRDVSNVVIDGQRFDKLALLEICVDDGLRMYIDLRTSGWGWTTRVEITAVATLELRDGIVQLRVVPTVKITTDIAWWLKLAAVLLMIGGVVIIVLGIFTGGGVAATGAGIGVFALGLGMYALVQLLPPDIVPQLPLSPDAIVDLLPGGLRERLGELTFLTDASWDDVSLAGFMTVPGELAPHTGGEVRLAPGEALDLDTGEVVVAGDATTRLDVDLVLRGGLGDQVVTMSRVIDVGSGLHHGSGSVAAGTSLAGRVGPSRPGDGLFAGRTLAAFGSSRLVSLSGRPYSAVAESDLRSMVFPASTTGIGVPAPGSTARGDGAAVFAARSSAGRLAKGVVWTDASGATWVRWRTYATPLRMLLETNHSTQTFGKHGVTDIVTILNARFRAVPTGVWGDGRSLSHQWFWRGTLLPAVSTIDDGARATVVGDRCTIDTMQGADLRGDLCVVATPLDGLPVTTCVNVAHIGRFPKPPQTGGTGGPGGGPDGGFGGGLGGGLGGSGTGPGGSPQM